MLKLTLNRFFQDETHTLGILKIEGHKDPLFYTLELPWKDNANNISCIPSGTYKCFYRDSPKNGNVYELRGTAHRSHVQIHKGNYVTDIEGCILLGLGVGAHPDGRRMVKNSGIAMDRLLEITKRQDVELTIFGGDNNWS